MKDKGYCKVASAILGTTVLTVPPMPRSVHDLIIEAVGSRHACIEIQPGVGFVMPAKPNGGSLTLADLQYSILFTSGDATFADAVVGKKA